MTKHKTKSAPLLLLVAGIKGAIGSTLALATKVLAREPGQVRPFLTTDGFAGIPGFPEEIHIAGWDTRSESLETVIEDHGVVPPFFGMDAQQELASVKVKPAPDAGMGLLKQSDAVQKDIDLFCRRFPDARPVFINLLPACSDCRMETMDDFKTAPGNLFPDLSYAMAAVRSGVPVVNFTPNDITRPFLVEAAKENGVPLAGRDGKTGQTYFKVVLASALKARNLYVDGWYSLNILGNADGRNLMDPARAESKLRNKTRLLDDILGYAVGEGYGEPAHTVRIDYYPPRGDAKEAWDVIDIKGLFGQPMSLRVNLQGRDSILAAPMVLDLAYWMVLLKEAGRFGPVSELGFYFKKPEGENPPVTFEAQIAAIRALAEFVAGSR